MFLFRKNIILVPVNYDGISLTKGLISFDCHNTQTNCNFKSYNLICDKQLLLGIAINKKLYRINVSPSNFKNFNFVINDVIKSGDDISCVLLEIHENSYETILWGSTQINSSWKSAMEFMLEAENVVPKKHTEKQNQVASEELKKNYIHDEKNDNKHQIESVGLNNNFNFDTATQNLEDKFFDGENLRADIFNREHISQKGFEEENIRYNSEENYEETGSENHVKTQENYLGNTIREDNSEDIHFFENEKIEEFVDKVINLTNEESFVDGIIQNNIQNNTQNMQTDIFSQNSNNQTVYNKTEESESFYNRISFQVDKMLNANPEEKVLDEIIPNSKFCKVNFDDNTGYYVFGVIYENSAPKYLCYGVPAQNGDNPPKELSQYYQWLPIDSEDENSNGFFMMYQDAVTGKNISVEVI